MLVPAPCHTSDVPEGDYRLLGGWLWRMRPAILLLLLEAHVRLRFGLALVSSAVIPLLYFAVVSFLRGAGFLE